MKVTKYKGYTVYSNGLIEKKIGHGYLSPSDCNGYKTATICLDGKTKTGYIHRFVWEAFNGKIPDGFEIDHIDGNPANNRLSNLRLLTREENASRGKQQFTKKELDEMRYLRNELGWYQTKIAERFGISQRSVSYLEQKGFTYVY